MLEMLLAQTLVGTVLLPISNIRDQLWDSMKILQEIYNLHADICTTSVSKVLCKSLSNVSGLFFDRLKLTTFQASTYMYANRLSEDSVTRRAPRDNYRQDHRYDEAKIITRNSPRASVCRIRYSERCFWDKNNQWRSPRSQPVECDKARRIVACMDTPGYGLFQKPEIHGPRKDQGTTWSIGRQGGNNSDN